MRHFEEAIALYRGAFLSGVGEEDDALFHEQQRLAVAAEAALEAAADGCEAEGRFAVATTYARRLLTTNPQSEENCARLMRLLARTGERAAARAYDAFAKRLKGINGAPPGEPIQRLARSLRPGLGAEAQQGDTGNLPPVLTRYFRTGDQ